MTRLAAKYRDVTDCCVRCSDQPTVRPDGLGPTTDAAAVVLLFRCEAGHCWQRTFRRSDLKQGPAKATTARRRHLANRSLITTATTARTTNDCTDESIAERSRAARQPSPRTGWNPDRRVWQLR